MLGVRIGKVTSALPDEQMTIASHCNDTSAYSNLVVVEDKCIIVDKTTGCIGKAWQSYAYVNVSMWPSPPGTTLPRYLMSLSNGRLTIREKLLMPSYGKMRSFLGGSIEWSSQVFVRPNFGQNHRICRYP